MDFNEYQEFTRTTAIYPTEVELAYLTAGLAEEAGEVAGKYKKSIRDNWHPLDFKEKVVLELGDVLWYLARYADAIGYTLADVADINREKLSSRKERNVLQGSGDAR